MAVQSKSLLMQHQPVFGTIGTAYDFVLPLEKINYSDDSVNRIGHISDGAYVPRTKRQKTAKQSKITAEGQMYYELWPFFFSGFDDMLASGFLAAENNTYAHDPNQPGSVTAGYDPDPYAPAWETQFYQFAIISDVSPLGDSGNNGMAGGNAFVDSWEVKGNAGSGDMSYSVVLQGGEITPNGTFSPSGLTPSSLNLCHPLDISIFTMDSTTSGGTFASDYDVAGNMTELGCNLLNWSLKCKTPAMPRWAANGGTLSYCGVKYVQPSIMFDATFITEQSTYDAIRDRYDNNTPLVMLFRIGTVGSLRFELYMSGYWTAVPSVHDEDSDEIVMKATFTAESPVKQVTTPHWITMHSRSLWNYDFGA